MVQPRLQACLDSGDPKFISAINFIRKIDSDMDQAGILNVWFSLHSRPMIESFLRNDSSTLGRPARQGIDHITKINGK